MWRLRKYKIIRIILWLIAKINKPLFEWKYYRYSNKKNTDYKTRLFVTTGNISLINALTIIKGNSNKKINDILVIDPCSASEDFVRANLSIAKQHKFKKIITNYRMALENALYINNIWRVDEIYAIYHPSHLPILISLYPNTKMNMFDEGCGSLVKTINDNIPNLCKFYTNKYIDKIDGWGFSEATMSKISNINNDTFKQIAKDYSKKFPINPPISSDDKNILLCGVYWSEIEREKSIFIKEQQDLVNSLINTGYKILYKPHPRATEMYGFENNPNVTIINSRLPIELYNLDVLAIISASSSAIMPAHYWDIPCFNNVNDYHISKENALCIQHPEWKINLFRYIVREYSPGWKELLKFDVVNASREKLKNQICKFYNDFISNKSLLSKNKIIKEYEEYLEQ